MNSRPPFIDYFLHQGFELAETHISWVLLGSREVYKIKKRLDLGFLDFSTRERRRLACDAEVELNARLAPGIYLGVVAIVPKGGGFAFAAPAAEKADTEPLEWAVKMVRLPAAARADQLLSSGGLGAGELERLAGKLAAFHQAAEVEAPTAGWGTLDVVRRNVAENFEQGRASLERCLTAVEGRQLEAWQKTFLDAQAELFVRREAAGRVRDGHGDLRLEHVYFLREEGGERIVVVDCIEFNRRFRFADVAADVAFLAMDLTKARRPDLAEIFLAAYARESDDFGLYGVIDFYESYRATVRAKIAGFVADDPGSSEKTRRLAEAEARRFFLLALAGERRALLPPRLIAVGGQIGSGKSTLAAALGRVLAAPVVEADRTRKFLLGVAPTTPVHEMPWQGAYSEEWTRRVYAELRSRAETVLLSGRTVLVDASFRRREERLALRQLAQELGVPFLFLECRADALTCKSRLARRARESSTSDGRLEIFDQLLAAWEDVGELQAEEHRLVDTGRPVQALVAELLAELPALPPAVG